MADAILPYFDEGSGEPIVLVHAFPLDGRMWAPQREALADAYRVITPDLRGFGRAAALGIARSLEDHARDLAALLDELGIPRATMVGLSMGGYVALAFLRLFRSRLARLGLADTRATADTDEARQARARNIVIVNEQGTASLVERMLPTLVSENAPAPLVDQVRAIAGSQPATSMAATLEAMRDRPDSTPLLPTIAIPSVVISGKLDRLTPPGVAEELASTIPGAKLELLRGAAHLSNLEAPAPFNEALVELLER
jgi:pimeloyl-ACP methyl ester carboxylesterase